MALEFAEHCFPIGRDRVVSDEGFHVQFGNGHFLAVGEAVLGRNDENEAVGIDDFAQQVIVAGIVSDEPEFELAVEEL